MLRFDLDDGLICTGQPSSEELQGLARDGAKTLINLRRAGEANHPEDWAAQVEAAGITHVHMPIAGAPDITEENARALAKTIDGASGKVVVQCGSSNRVGALLALKAKYVDGKGAEESLSYGKAAGLTDLEGHVKGLLGL